MSALLFDLDGTLVDSLPGIVACMNETLGTSFTHDAYRPYVGPPLQVTMARLGVPEDEIDATVVEYRRRYRTLMLEGSVPYEGIAELLAELPGPLGVATSKARPLARELLDFLGLARHFDAIEGPVPPAADGKPGTVAAALGALGLTEATMIGDRVHDVEGGQAHGLRTIGVLWGFGDAAELAGADELAPTVADLRALLR